VYPHTELEPHGLTLRISYSGSPRFNTDAYFRNGLFSDGHVENRYRQGKIMMNGDSVDELGWLNKPTPWMKGYHVNGSFEEGRDGYLY